jgi:hypothetical protein
MNDQASSDCPICHSPLPDPTQAQRRRDSFGFSISDLKQSHARGCGFCGILIESINRQIHDKIELDSDRYSLMPAMESQRRHVTLSTFGGSPYDGLDFYLLSSSCHVLSARNNCLTRGQMSKIARLRASWRLCRKYTASLEISKLSQKYRKWQNAQKHGILYLAV